LEEEVHKIKEQITNGLAIDLACDYCHGPVFGKPRVLKFADFERFFFVAILVKVIIVKNIREE
jgi:hypothetical protein